MRYSIENALLSANHLGNAQQIIPITIMWRTLFTVMYKLWKILKEMGIPDHLTCLLRNLYAGQEATVRTGHEQQTGHPAEYIM